MHSRRVGVLALLRLMLLLLLLQLVVLVVMLLLLLLLRVCAAGEGAEHGLLVLTRCPGGRSGQLMKIGVPGAMG